MDTPRALTRASLALEMAEKTQPLLNAFTEIDRNGAMERAQLIEDDDTRPLAGVPIAVKDLIDHAGHVNTCGSAFYREVPAKSAPCVDALESAGGVIVGRTGLHEWAFGFSSENPHFGPVRNPWNTDTSTGGSSGGSGAAVAAGVTPIAIGTDTGGSVRVPAALCGTYGLKVTHGRIPLGGVFPLVPSIDTVGPLADSVASIDAAYRVMSGDVTPEPNEDALRIGIPGPWVESAPMSEEVEDTFADVLTRLSRLGHHVRFFDSQGLTNTPSMWNAIAGEVTEVHGGFRAAGEPYGADVAQRLDDAANVAQEDIDAAHAWQNELRSRFRAAFEDFDLLLTPTTPVTHKIIGEDMIGEHHYRMVLSYFTALVNHSLNPALAMPVAGSNGPPVSIQAIGPESSEARLIGFARSMERAGVVRFRLASG